MSSLIYNSCLDGVARGRIDFDLDVFKLMLVDNNYRADRSHSNIALIRGEIDGMGYYEGGAIVETSLQPQKRDNRLDIIFGPAVWSPSSLRAAGGVYYKPLDGELIAFIDFGETIISTNGKFEVLPSTIMLTNVMPN